MPNPSWRQLAAIPESLIKAAILRALDIEPPIEGVSSQLHLSNGTTIQRTDIGYVLYQPNCQRSQYLDAPMLLRELKWPVGTPTGDLLRAWLKRWGWTPKSKETTVTAPQEATRTVI